MYIYTEAWWAIGCILIVALGLIVLAGIMGHGMEDQEEAGGGEVLYSRRD